MKTLLELEDNDCRFPFGEGPFLFCGEEKQSGLSYCSHHHAVCFTPSHHRQGHIAPPQTISAMRKRDLPAVLILNNDVEDLVT